MASYTKDEMNQKLAKDIWSEKLGVAYEDIGKDYGKYTDGSGKLILSKDLLGGGKEDSTKLAAVMGHEGSHYYGNKLEGIAHAQGYDTYAQINKIFNLEGDSSFVNSMLDGILSKESWVANTGDTQHWKLTTDGNIVWDGKKDLLNEVGEVIRVDKTGSYSQSLLNWLGDDSAKNYLKEKGIDMVDLSRTEIAEKLFDVSGVEWDTNATSPSSGKNTGAWVPQTMPGGNLYNQSTITDLLQFQLSSEYALNLGKISQESPNVAYWVGDNGKEVNAMKTTGCFYFSTLGAVQTQSDKLLSASMINSLTQTSLKNGWLETDTTSIWPTGSASREKISALAFDMLGMNGYSLDFSNVVNPLGQINIGSTKNNNKHASEWSMTKLLFDPYQGVTYTTPRIDTLPYSLTKPKNNSKWNAFERIK